MENNYQNVQILIRRMSFKNLISSLYEQQIDAAVSLDINFSDQSGIIIRNIKNIPV